MKTNIDDLLNFINDNEGLKKGNNNKEKLNVEIFDENFLFEKVKTYSDVCFYLNEDELIFEDFEKFGNFSIQLYNIAKIKQIAKLFNGDWRPNWENTSEYKYFPWFAWFFSFCWRFVFYGSYSDISNFTSAVAYYKSKTISDYVGKTFIDIYRLTQ